MKFCILTSRKDTAGKNIFNCLNENFPSIDSYLIEEDSINAENIDEREEFENYDFFIFATKHQSKKGRKSLSVHAPGNWKDTKFGGKQGKLCMTSAFFLKKLFLNLNEENNNQDYETTLEVTHHGPFLKKPCCFIEIGSSEKEWQNKNAGKVIVKTINKTIKEFQEITRNWVPAIGIGGLHYCQSFNKIQKNSKYALSHIIPQYVFPINKEMLEEAINKTEEDVKTAIIDWKGLKSKERQETIKLLEELGLEYKRTSNVEK